MKFSKTQLGTPQKCHKGPYYAIIYMMIHRLGICLRDLDIQSNLEQLIHLHIQVIYEYAE